MKKVLIVATSTSKLGDTGKRTGAWLDELVTPYYKFKDAGYDVHVASPHGKDVPIDPKSKEKQYMTESINRYLNDKEAHKYIHHSKKLCDVKPEKYDAIFYPGGHGVMWDIANDLDNKRILENLYHREKPIGAVCHGAAGLLLAETIEKESIVYERKVNCYSNEEEEQTSMNSVVPFLLESRLVELGGLYERGEVGKEYVVKDGNLVTGQNPKSVEKVIDEMLKLMAGYFGEL